MNDIVEVITKQGIKLDGYFYNNKNEKCILFIPGLNGNYNDTKFIHFVIEECKNNNYDFLFSHNQGSYEIKEYDTINGKRIIGSAYEKFEDSIYDIDAWIKYLIDYDYKELVIIAHSLGCNKLVYFLNNKKYDLIKKIILLAPQDNSNFDKLDIHEGMMDEAINNLNNGLDNEILSKKFLGFTRMSSRTYYELLNNKNINNIPYKNFDSKFLMLNNVSISKYIIIGDIDIGDNGKKYLDNLCGKVNDLKYDILVGANHNFKNKEIDLSKLIFDYIRE